ncbi:hypothetical protein [Microcoleus sp. B4-D4]|uniref:hypothetical protein n=1 Tax=Microcoleus sp. B4-D4 TaxID=2818667 RepID=UPI002FD6CD2F
MKTNLLLNLQRLPNSLPSEGSIRIELVKGLLVFRISTKIQERIETLTAQKTESALTSEQETELNQYQELVDYLNLVNETIKKSFLYHLHGTVKRYDDPFEPAAPSEDWEVLQ